MANARLGCQKGRDVGLVASIDVATRGAASLFRLSAMNLVHPPTLCLSLTIRASRTMLMRVSSVAHLHHNIRMIYLLFIIFVVFAPLALSRTAAQLCRGTAARADDGNWYCSQVTAITYKNISQPGEYNKTTRVNPSTGLCDHEPVAYSGAGPATPLIGEVLHQDCMHLREC